MMIGGIASYNVVVNATYKREIMAFIFCSKSLCSRIYKGFTDLEFNVAALAHEI